MDKEKIINEILNLLNGLKLTDAYSILTNVNLQLNKYSILSIKKD